MNSTMHLLPKEGGVKFQIILEEAEERDDCNN